MIKEKTAGLSFAIHFSMVRVCEEMFTPLVGAVLSIEHDERGPVERVAEIHAMHEVVSGEVQGLIVGDFTSVCHRLSWLYD